MVNRELSFLSNGIEKVSVFICLLLLNLQKQWSKFLFPKFVISNSMGFVLYLCQDLSCFITETRFWYFCSDWSVNFSVIGRKFFWTSFFDSGIISKWSCKTNVLLNLYFDLIQERLTKYCVCWVFFFYEWECFNSLWFLLIYFQLCFFCVNVFSW